MRTGVYFCNCGGNVSDKIDAGQIESGLGDQIGYFKTCDFLCSEEGKEFLRADVSAERPDRVVVAACSPREYERAFRATLSDAGHNPYLFQMVNIREHVAWVTPDPAAATHKAQTAIRAAIARVELHEPLETRGIAVRGDVLVIGAGPAGLKTALALAEAGRKVTVVEKTAVLGGMPMRYEELFPAMECGPCMLEPLLSDVLHGNHAPNIEVLMLAEVADVAGYYGNFQVKIRCAPRYVDIQSCIGCGECIPVCPATRPNEYSYGIGKRSAIAFAFSGALPNVPFLDMTACLRGAEHDCQACLQACPVEDAIRFDDRETIEERTTGAIVIATGAGLYDISQIPNLGYGLPGVYTSLEFERILAANGPTSGQIVLPDGRVPSRVAIVHCAGSLEPEHVPYCSGVCCQYALKFNHLVRKKLPDAQVHHFYKEMVVPGKEAFQLYRHATHDPATAFVRYRHSSELRIESKDGALTIQHHGDTVTADLVVLCPAMVPAPASQDLAELLDIPRDGFGFHEEMHGRMLSPHSKRKGIFLAGACQRPTDIESAINQGVASAGYILAGLIEGRQLEIEPIVASVLAERCSGCKSCGSVCPYKAIGYAADTGKAEVNALLCQGCGTCVAACPAAAIKGNHFSDEQILAELEAILA
jgi:heterodisulfide reductase subunit A